MRSLANAAAESLGEKIFSEADQYDFATASHDWNPLHMDAVAARRLLAGGQVVHGVHLLIHALERWGSTPPRGRLCVSCSFTNPVHVGDRVAFNLTNKSDFSTKITASVDGLPCTEVEIKQLSAEGEVANATDPGIAGKIHRRIGALIHPTDEVHGSQIDNLFILERWPDTLASRFPNSAKYLGADALSALAQLSFFVGMVCPGLHSVFSSLTFTVVDTIPAASELRFKLEKYDPRFRLFTVGFAGIISGELRALGRAPPQQQPTAHEVSAHVNSGEFKGTKSWVIGGSRGLGECCAKIITAGGGDVVISYANGQADADAVVADINASGRGKCAAMHLDIRECFPIGPNIDPATLQAVYFFATPRIYTKRPETFNRKVFDEFADFYLDRFYQLCHWLNRSQRSRPLKVYLPSTVFIDQRPLGMTEYAMAKAAAEVLADDLNLTLKNVTIIHTRLPRLATDQTASILKTPTESNILTMLSVVQTVAAA